MANHIRRQIRERAGTVLTGLTTTGNNVFETRIYPLENTNLPALLEPVNFSCIFFSSSYLSSSDGIPLLKFIQKLGEKPFLILER